MFLLVLNIAVVICGLYSIYDAYKAKKTGKVKVRRYEFSSLKKAKDSEEYKKRYIKFEYWLGMILVISGGSSIMNHYGLISDDLNLIVSISYMIFIFVFVWKAIDMLPSYKDKK